ncbi:LysR family transcriptional regulator [Mesorhizobium sp. M00.F.Ca.ET.216.01.1.1]|uniref:LysR family transcriptional regulator n=1 Tax=Mesorhizobium sp. M00.F.Ca.ET.216.01.1.1 TaxID=2500528 RepID=UPI000FDB66D4|nr:LysR family transcriptional regulator [Mesorhizobium sp. M00.F.Ca.ET.216.01.1.1]TGQ30037.1 LysR family transcriptional regulator [Mesorhizobium sp. M00.F.Ca.ET.216.01.1.1]TJW07054.1 MAG: LysR family transcriptional regulator [Mesorhizobium sp.]
MSDRLQQLAIFVRTVETGSFSKVAREFGLSQPSVSRTVAALEERLGVKLLTRTTRQLSLTDAGEALLPRARDALAGVEEAESAARGADRLSGTLRVALSQGFGARQIVPRLPAFLDNHPLLKIDLMMSDLYENLIAEGADMALRLGEQPDSSFVTRKLATNRRLFVASPTYLAGRGTPKTLAELGRHHLISGPSDRNEQNWTAHRDGIAEIQPVSPRVRTRSTVGVLACASAGLGIAIASTWMCADELASGALVELLADYRLDPVAAYVVFPAGRRPSQKARAFSDYLEMTLAAEQ